MPSRRTNRMGSGYNNWISSLRSNYSRDLARRDREDAEAENAPGSQINKVERVHWYIKDNANNHHTIKFDQVHDKTSPKPVLRRGQTFYLAMRFKTKDFDVKQDRVVLNFKCGPKPSVQKDTMMVLPVLNDKFTRKNNEWDVRIDSGSKGKDLVMQVYIPATTMVGIWRLDVRTGLQDRSITTAQSRFTDETDVFILFNPWCKDDHVYIDDDAKREEYIMNDKGKVYVGSHRRSRGRPWAYGQFDEVVLPVAMYILDLNRLAYPMRGNPVQVVRAVSAGVNDSDEDGILQGRWDGEYSDGVAPFKWIGSVRILEEYMKNGYTPVKYGQCWVFSAITTTICRALGVPCRSVTNFVSAHDTNSSLTIDKFFDKEGEEIEGGPDGDNWDSIWNFHVWNDVWMARPDLPKGYGGWQCIDATPQEESDHKMQCGPASLEAIRRGDIGLGYDCPFVFAEVNADVMHWGEDSESDWGYKRLKLNKFHIGRKILTRKPGFEDDNGEDDQDNVLDEYKNREGSEAERLAIHNAVRGSRRAQQYYNYEENVTEDVNFDLEDIDTIEIGEDFKVKINVQNNSEEPRTITAALTARSLFYTGVVHSTIKKAEGKFILQPKQKQEVALTIGYHEYWKRLQEHCNIKMYSICRVQETGQTWTEEDDFIVEKPKLEIQAPAEGVVRQPCEAVFSFTNPLDEPLTGMELSIDGAGLIRPRSIPISGSVGPNEKFEHRFKFTPRIHGERKIIASFNSTELFDISGIRTINVKKTA